MATISISGVALSLGIASHRIQPGVYRVRCRSCGVTGREHAPRIAPNCSAGDVRKEIRAHAEAHLEMALDEHRDRMLADPELTLAKLRRESEARKRDEDAVP